MLNVIFLFGTLSGLIVIGGIIATLGIFGEAPHAYSELLGYLLMLVALSMIFFGIKRYRDQELGGVIGFGHALLVGLGIAVVAGVIYVMVWEVYLAATNFAFTDAYANAMIEAERAKGVTGDALNRMMAEQTSIMQRYKEDPLFRIPITFLEILPVGLFVTLISAAILRNPKVLPAQA